MSTKVLSVDNRYVVLVDNPLTCLCLWMWAAVAQSGGHHSLNQEIPGSDLLAGVLNCGKVCPLHIAPSCMNTSIDSGESLSVNSLCE